MANFNYVKTFAQANGQITTLALDSGGTLWEENVNSTPNVLNQTATNFLPGDYCKSVTQSDEEWMCLSNLLIGTDIPKHGSNLDRISQVGPGAPPTVVGSNAGTNVYTIVASPNGLTQAAAASDPGDAGHFQAVNWSDGPFSTNVGNVLTIFYSNETVFANPDPNLIIGGGVYLNMTSAPFTGLTGTYIITSLGQGFPPHGSGAQRWYFTVQVTEAASQFVGGPDSATGTYQVTLATMTTTAPAAINVGDKATIASATAPAWDGTWTILATVNGAQLSITSTSLTSNIATYNYTLISGSTPSSGQQVTITGCTNGPVINGTSIFNRTNAVIDTTGAGFFTVVLNGANVTTAAESGSAIVQGTIFQFDPGLSNLGLGVSAIFGNSGGGTVTTGGVIGSGLRQAVTIFQTRNGYLTAPSPPVVFETTGSTNQLVVSNIAIGPSNVIARIVAFTGSNGGNFFYIPVPVTIAGAGQPVTYTSTVVNDNVTTQATFTFTDAVLLAATAIDIQGNNLFNQVELGSATWNLAYAGRMFYGGVNNKVQNFTNTTFDGGYLPNVNGISFPLGWTPDTTRGGGGNLVPSTIFGNAYQITNSTGSTGTVQGLISQSAFQDAYKVPIILPNTTYGIRLWARVVAGSGGSVFVQLASPKFGRAFGAFSLTTGSMSNVIQIFTGTILGTAFATSVPPDLMLQAYGANLASGVTVEIDRFEIYPLNQPVLTTDLIASYFDNDEAFDGVTGLLGVGEENNQPAIGAFVNYDILYVLKTNSMFSTQDSPNNEPAGWTIREVSNKIGTCGILAYDYGEEWMVTACRAGLYLFSGGEPVKISQEIQPTWDAINWTAASSIWVRNDTTKRKVLIGVPMTTPNQWLPNAPVNTNPTTPNVVLMMNYKELNTSNELSERGPVKISYSGKLITWDMSRKWSIWQIPTFYADFITRPDGNAPLFFCQANNIISQQIANQLNDNGAAINGTYYTYGFVKPDQEQPFGPLLGDHRKLARYLEANVSGTGTLSVTLLPNTLTPAAPNWPWTVAGGIPLTNPAQYNVERSVDAVGNRIYLAFSTNAVNQGFQLSEAKLTMTADKHAPIRGM
jgi:hypothetical protein